MVGLGCSDSVWFKAGCYNMYPDVHEIQSVPSYQDTVIHFFMRVLPHPADQSVRFEFHNRLQGLRECL